MRIGTIAMMVEATPVVAYFTAISENDTPRKGPNTDPMLVPIMPGLLLKAFRMRYPFFKIIMIKAKPIMPATILIWVAAKAW